MNRLNKLVVIGLAGLVGCATDPAADGRDDSFTTDGKLDGFQCTPGEAAAILQVANTASLATLKNDVHLAEKAADNIVAFRAGDDEVAGTSDDEEFGSLAELDAVPYIGPTAFQKLLTYVHDADLVDDAVARQWTSTTIANGDHADFALTKAGKPVIVYQTSSGFVLRQANGSTVALPSGITGGPYGNPYFPQVAVDGAATVHVLYGVAPQGQPVSFKHLTIGATGTSFTERDPLRADRVWLDAGPQGQVYAFTQQYRSSTVNDYIDATLVTFGPNGGTTSEPLWEMHKGAHVAFNVGRDGYPAVAWAGTSDAYTALQYARRGQTGWQQPHVAGSGSYRSPDLATSGTASALVVVDGALLRQSGQTLSSSGRLDGLTTNDSVDAQVDNDGIVHVCTGTYGDGTVHAQVDATGNYTIQGLGQGGCWLGVDETGTLHRLYTLGTVINHATFQ